MTERPILFNGAMVRALLDGRKTQTRRIVKPQFPIDAVPTEMCAVTSEGWQTSGHSGFWCDDCDPNDEARVRCEFGVPGDRLWVRETFCRIDGQTQPSIETDYRATYTHGARLGDSLGIKKKWTPSIFMPRHASRITLEITNVRVERLQAINEIDAINEGIEKTESGYWSLYGQAEVDGTYSARTSFRALWESINSPDAWNDNPWVWVVEFKRLSKERA